MPSFGICAPLDKAELLKSAGFDHIEPAAVPLFDGRIDDDTQLDASAVKRAALPVAACNMLMPGDEVTITGDAHDPDRLTHYLDNTLRRASAAGVPILVFGSGAARKVRVGQSRDQALQRILTFLKLAAPLAARHGVTLVIEPLRSAECNIINGVAEAMQYVRAIDHPHVQCLVDSYHLWEEDEPLSHLEAALPSIKHVHVADKGTRAGSGADPSQAGAYREFFAVLKSGGYDGAISVEGKHGWDEMSLGRIHDFLHQQWNAA